MAMVVSYVGVKGIIEQDGKVLLLKGTKHDGQKFWDVPGGRIDDEEMLQEALVRELDEELPGIKNVAIGEIMYAQRIPGFPWGDKALTLVYYAVKADLSNVAAVSDEHEELVWMDLDTAIAELRPRIADPLRAYKARKQGDTTVQSVR